MGHFGAIYVVFDVFLSIYSLKICATMLYKVLIFRQSVNCLGHLWAWIHGFFCSVFFHIWERFQGQVPILQSCLGFDAPGLNMTNEWSLDIISGLPLLHFTPSTWFYYLYSVLLVLYPPLVLFKPLLFLSSWSLQVIYQCLPYSTQAPLLWYVLWYSISSNLKTLKYS